eukprot:9018390-Ditylum_brightwellii.AAC.1
MHKIGAEDVSKSITYKTLVMIAFEVIKPKEVYPLRKKLMELFERFQEDDTFLTIKETLGDNIWSKPDEIPSGKEFETTFKVRNSPNIRHIPKLVIYCTLYSRKKEGDIKFEPK